ncbi:MAG: glutathione-regulated potassium-efflux system protein KefB [Lysobacter sp.]|nr:MAG: glutathione-regulated potassium-efflux system protein KefB [Lysobacter sp.]
MHGEGLQLGLVFLCAAVIAVPLFKRFGLGAVLGYLAAGVVLGPFGLKVIEDAAPVLTASEIGVVMMLFVIGLELSPSRLWVMRKPVFGLGGLQVALSGLALGGVGLLWGQEWKPALVVGLALALSSTAVSLQLLSERKAMNTPYGRNAFAILLFQDVAAIPLIAVIPLLGVAASEGHAGRGGIVKAVAAIVAVAIGGRFLLRYLFRIAARIGVPEMLTASALFAVLGAAWVMSLAGLSMGLGAFLAGVLLADSEFRHEIESQIEPFKGLLLGLFFMAVGMSIDLPLIVAEPLPIVLGTVALLATKSVVLFVIALRPARMRWREALQLGVVLALGGEFAFVVLAEAVKAGLIDAALQNRLVAIVGLSMALTPLSMIAIAQVLRAYPEKAAPREFDAIPDHQPQVILAGFGRFGQIVARILVAQKIPFIALETDAQHLDFMRRFGNKVYFGDASRPDLLRAAGAGNAKLFINAIDNIEANLRVTRVVRRMYPDLTVFARAHDRRHAWQSMDLGAKVTRETFASGLEMGRDVLIALGIPPDTAAERVRRFRAHDEDLLLQQHLFYDDDDALLASARKARGELEELFEADAETPTDDRNA